MEIRLLGKFDPRNYSKKEAVKLSYIGNGFVFVDYLDEDIFLGDVFILEDGTEIILKEIKLQFNTKEPLTEMGRGWKCLCRFDNLDLKRISVVRDWYGNKGIITVKRKEA